MRRLRNPDLDVPFLFQQLNAPEALVTSLLQALPYLTDEQMVEAFSYANSFGKRSWLLQAAILYEAQKRSIYGEKTLEAIRSPSEKHGWRVFGGMMGPVQ